MNRAAFEGPGLIRVEAASFKEALHKIGERFGKDVSVVHTRVVRRKGMMGLMGATGVEVYVTGREEYQAWREQGSEVARAESTSGGAAPVTRVETAPDVAVVLRRLQSQIRHVVSREQITGAEKLANVKAAPAARRLHPVVREAETLLRDGCFSPKNIEEILSRLGRRRLPGTSSDPTEIRALARIQLAELVRPKIPPCLPIRVEGGRSRSRVVALVGPTGVGKTTTIAKLASLFGIVQGRRVGLITLDTYRLGAVDQLRKYADIMGIPLSVVEVGQRLEEALEAMRDREIVLVDTAGRSQKDHRRLAEIKDMLKPIGTLEVHLCVSLAASRRSVLEVVESFRTLPYGRLLITKLDEASAPGGLLDVFEAARVPVSYLTCGQEVPDDILPASENRLEALLLGD